MRREQNRSRAARRSYAAGPGRSRFRQILTALSITAILTVPTVDRAFAAEAAGAPESMPLPTYQPPMRGAPTRRVGGGSRGADENGVELNVLAPEHLGRTAFSQPVLYWFISRPAPSRLEITLTDPRTAEPKLELDLGTPQAAGLQRIDLARQGVKLESGVQYEWFVARVSDERQRSADQVTGGAIERVEPPPDLDPALLKQDPAAAAFRFAATGFWYDAFHAINEALARHPGDATLLRQRAALLEQVGLGAVAEDPLLKR